MPKMIYDTVRLNRDRLMTKKTASNPPTWLQHYMHGPVILRYQKHVTFENKVFDQSSQLQTVFQKGFWITAVSGIRTLSANCKGRRTTQTSTQLSSSIHCGSGPCC
jgi:Tfp pilus assembly protein FimT